MTLDDHIAADLDTVFFADNGIGVVTGLYRNAAGTEVHNLNGILDRAYYEAPGEVVGVSGYRTEFLCRAAHFPSTWSVSTGDTLEVQVDPVTNTTFTVVGAEPDGTGMVTLVLKV